MGITRSLIDWCDNKTKEALYEEDTSKAYGKAFVGGFVEGFMDAAIVLYIPVVIACYVWQGKTTKK